MEHSLAGSRREAGVRRAGGKQACGSGAAHARTRARASVYTVCSYVRGNVAARATGRRLLRRAGGDVYRCTADVGILMCESEDKAQGRCTSSCRRQQAREGEDMTRTRHMGSQSSAGSHVAAHERHGGVPMHVWQRVSSGASRRASTTLHWRRLRRAGAQDGLCQRTSTAWGQR